MKPRKVKRLLQGLALGACVSSWTVTYAAQQEIFWGKVDNYAGLLKNFTIVQAPSTPKGLRLPTHLSTQQNSVNTFQYVSGIIDQSKKSHVRYDQYYRDIPVWEAQVIYHVSSTDTTITGEIINGIEKDIPNLTGKLSLEDAKKIALGKHSVSTKINAEKIIYFDQEVSSKAILAYHISYLTRTADGPAILSYIIDANTGKIIDEWNALPNLEIGKGPGGVNVEGRVKYRSGKFQYGLNEPEVNALGLIEVEFSNATCTISNNLFRVISLRNRTEGQLPFELPASTADERAYQIKAFAYSCAFPNYVNVNDAGFAPINDGISPVNDAAYFVKQTFTMLTDFYKVPTPVGFQVPIRVYTHLGSYDNAFACGTSCMRESGVVGPQQLVFGNGEKDFSPLTDGDGVSHEFGHLVTEHFSNLIYNKKASGGINESFSDMTAMAMLEYQRSTLNHPWYWDGKDWTTGASVSKTGKPLRYLDNPPLDGASIDNVADFRGRMEPHLSSGIFNKAFYLLSTTPGWGIEKAYQVMLDANMKYWTKGTSFQDAACAVVRTARERAYSDQDVRNIFQQVGINNLQKC